MEIDQMMTWEEIEAAFNGEWVLVEYPEFAPTWKGIPGRVIFHSKDRAALYAKMSELPRMHHAVKYIGGLPEGMEMIL